ncbi:PLP-dependent aminotransferase family protein [Pseudomonas abieticivorans]|uniref:MocR-like pyridoxine biosynthesis transcription factor PdxR n=1 Tax=Pseudomonas abieticivorans TaxID=2931382 RepID=UPI0020C02B18|nr:PLP-dependent aminotransferase family protein [Pseudomonas sp. PIA16]
MELHIVFQGRKDLGEQLYRHLREGIESGRLAAGTRLPPSRLLAEQLKVSRKTVADTYQSLTYDGLLSGRVGSGTFVNARMAQATARQGTSDLASAAVVALWRDMKLPLHHPGIHGGLRGDFIGGASSRAQFPHDEWRRCTLHALRQSSRSRGLYSAPEGVADLREGIARHVGFSRGVRCSGEDVLVTNGAQQALDLVSRVLIEPGCRVAMEDPGYPPARLLFMAQGAEVIGVPVDEEGIQVQQIPDGTRLIYVTPSHQFPLGMAMSTARREALLARALELGAIIIEDDYDCEFRYEGLPTDSLQGLDQHGLVAYIGTFSKTLLPELRLGYTVLPPAIHAAVRVAKQLTDWHTSTQNQLALAKFMAEGHLHKHIRRSREVYAVRRERIISRFESDLAPWFAVVPSSAGYHLAVTCRAPLDIDQVIAVARYAEVGLYSLAPFFFQQATTPGLIMGYGAIDLLEIDPALDRLRDVLEQLAPV